MNKRLIPLLAIFVLLAGCAGISIVPAPEAKGQINVQDLSITQSNQQITLTTKLMDLEVRPYQMQQNICSFTVLIRNDRAQQISLPATRFILSDSKGNQYRSVSPERIRKIVAELDPYLIPYPYIGYYYEGDAARARIRNEFNREVTYFPTRNPQNIALEALPEGKIGVNKQISGLVYFLADLRTMSSFTLEASALLADGSVSSDFIFPFTVVKQ